MAVDFILKLDGINGESKLEKHKDEIDIETFSFGASNPTSQHRGGGASAGRVHVGDMVFTKLVDAASPNLFKYCCNGKAIPKGKLTLRKAGETAQEYLTVEMTDIMVSSWQPGGVNSSDQVSEQFALSYATIKWEYKPQNPDGSLGGAISAKWDVKASKIV